MPLTLDTGALVGLQRGDKRITDVVRDAHGSETDLVVPANALAEWWRGGGRRQEDVLERLKPFATHAVDDVVAKLSGRALEWYWQQMRVSGQPKERVTASLTIDATVLATACLAARERPEPVPVPAADLRSEAVGLRLYDAGGCGSDRDRPY